MSTIFSAVREITALKPIAGQACTLFLQECKRQGIEIFITETYRSQARQDYLYQQGRTSPGKIVTSVKVSKHTSGMAWDIACKGADTYSKEVLTRAGNVGTKLGITWGGLWKGFVDMPHFEISDTWKPTPVLLKTEEPKKEAPKEETPIKINGKIYSMDIILKDGSNYVKVRDLEKAGFAITNEGNMAVLTTA